MRDQKGTTNIKMDNEGREGEWLKNKRVTKNI
jgi:hypothetical protein